MLDSLERARRHRELFPRLGGFVAEILVPATARVEHTGREGHFTVWATADELLEWVVRVVPLV